VIRVLAVSDEISDVLTVSRLEELNADVIVSCGDLPWDYLEYLVTVANKPLAYVPGNHDPAPRRHLSAALGIPLPPVVSPTGGGRKTGPEGCINIDRAIVDVGGLRVAGLGGSMRYSEGPYQYTESEMSRRGRRLLRRARVQRLRDGRGVDVLVTHAPPLDLGDERDRAHRGFGSFHRLVEVLMPKVMLHGHIHPHGRAIEDHHIGDTRVLNAVGYRLVEVDP
jgi:predicted phosphodiesterase